jgi:hypothetical protein
LNRARDATIAGKNEDIVALKSTIAELHEFQSKASADLKDMATLREVL